MTRAASPCAARPNISVEDNAREIDRGYDLMTPAQ